MATQPLILQWPGKFSIPQPGTCSEGGSASTMRPGCAAERGHSITLMIWYYWTSMPERRASRMAVGRNVLADAGYSV